MWGCAELQVCVAAATSSRGLDPTCTCGKCRASKVVFKFEGCMALRLRDSEWHYTAHGTPTRGRPASRDRSRSFERNLKCATKSPNAQRKRSGKRVKTTGSSIIIADHFSTRRAPLTDRVRLTARPPPKPMP
eukprot:scaffold54975_cov57-Phaeocystis_antarctica.AAC.2